jgi:hypothetical protein
VWTPVSTSNERATPLHQQDEQIHRLALEVNRTTVVTQFVGGYVEIELAKPEDLAWFGRGHELSSDWPTLP